MQNQNLILTTLHRIRFESVAAFIASLHRTGYDGRVVAFVSEIDDESLASLRSNGVETVLFRFSGRHVKQRLARLWPLCRPLFASGLPMATKERLAHLVFHLFYRRHLLYLEFLREHRNEFDRVLLTDCRDVYFQADPFSWPLSDGVHVFLEDDSHFIGKCPHHISWLKSAFGMRVLEELARNTVSCAGTVLGDVDGLLKYLSAMVAMTMAARSLREPDGDQGIHNYVVHNKLVPGMTVHDNLAGPVMTMAAMPRASVRCDSRGWVINDAGRVVPVLHQYDRMPDVAGVLLHRLDLPTISR